MYVSQSLPPSELVTDTGKKKKIHFPYFSPGLTKKKSGVGVTFRLTSSPLFQTYLHCLILRSKIGLSVPYEHLIFCYQKKVTRNAKLYSFSVCILLVCVPLSRKYSEVQILHFLSRLVLMIKPIFWCHFLKQLHQHFDSYCQALFQNWYIKVMSFYNSTGCVYS